MKRADVFILLLAGVLVNGKGMLHVTCEVVD